MHPDSYPTHEHYVFFLPLYAGVVKTLFLSSCFTTVEAPNTSVKVFSSSAKDKKSKLALFTQQIWDP